MKPRPRGPPGERAGVADLLDRAPAIRIVAMTPKPPRMGPGRTREILVVAALTADRRAAAPLVDQPAGAVALRRRDLRGLGLLDLFATRDLDIDPSLIAVCSAGVPVPGRAGVPGTRSRRPASDSGLDRQRARSRSRPSPGSPDGLSAAGPGRWPRPSRHSRAPTSRFRGWRSPTPHSCCSGCWRWSRASVFWSGPAAYRAVLLGLAVGAAQLFKYNGWLAGAFVILAAAVWLAAHRWGVAIAAHRVDLGLGHPGGGCRRDGLLAMVCVRPVARRLRGACWHTSAAIWAV